MTDLYLYDDAAAREWQPFALTRPASELIAGAMMLRERWERALGLRAVGVVTAAHLEEFDEPWGVSVVQAKDVIPKGSVLANSRCAAALTPSRAGDVWQCDGRVAAVLLGRDVPVRELRNGTVQLEELVSPGERAVNLSGRWMGELWDLVVKLSDMLNEDIPVVAETGNLTPRTGSVGIIAGSHPVFAEEGAIIEPQVYFDTSLGPVLIRRGATVRAFTRINGPCFIGRDSQVSGDRVSGSTIGDDCRVHGEMIATVLLGHSNKSHDGFVGHSYFGRWVNVGAGTITSNLKNTYGTVHLWTPHGERDTGAQFLGTFFGDHAKTGIGTPLTTGCVIGTAANVFGSTMPPKVVPPFAWGDRVPYETYRVDKFLEVAKRMMARRHVELSERQARALTAAFEERWGSR